MDAALAQLLALVSHGNQWLAAPHGDPPNLLRDNSTFQYVKEVGFELRKRWGRRKTWSSVDGWLRSHRERGTRRLILDSRNWGNPDLANVGSASARRSAIIAEADKGSQVWGSHWLTDLGPGDEYPPDRRIWRVIYKGESVRRRPPPRTPPIDDALSDLTTALERIRDFALEQRIEGWPEWFQEALDLATAQYPEIPYHPDVLPARASEQQRRLAAGAFKAWVFGGMGSWNDKSVEGESAAESDRILSERLYAAILQALDAVGDPSGRR